MAPEIVGETDTATHFVKIQYCGGWGYRPHCTKFIDQVSAALQDKDYHIQYQLVADVGITGNFEISMYQTADLSGEGKLIYSKKASGKFPHADAGELEKACEEITKCINWDTNSMINLNFYYIQS